MAGCLEGCGRPLLVADALAGWQLEPLRAASLARRFGASLVVVNDRAPARRADAQAGRPQASVAVTLADYVDHYPPMRGDDCLGSDAGSEEQGCPPLYLNGWRAFSAHPELVDECPLPYFLRGVDHTQAILCEARIVCHLIARSDALIADAASD